MKIKFYFKPMPVPDARHPAGGVHFIADHEKHNQNMSAIFVSLVPGYYCRRGWSGDAMVLGKLPVPGRSTDLDYSRARVYCTCSRCGWVFFFFFLDIYSLVYHFSYLSTLSLGDGPI